MKFTLLLFVVVVLACTEAFDLEKEWSDFKTKFNKVYSSETEEANRKQIFSEALTKIEEHNKKYDAGEVSFSTGINEFADLTREEFRQKHASGLAKPPQ